MRISAVKMQNIRNVDVGKKKYRIFLEMCKTI